MQDVKYIQAATQVLEILKYMPQKDINRKIPKSFINFLQDISNKENIPKFNHELPINRLNINEQTKEILGFMYITWWSNEDERKEYKKIIQTLF